jgi:molybdopterin/thiamine biosynthesis adenylyltransferase
MNYSVVIQETVNSQLKNHLIRNDRQEDLCFALYTPGKGKNRITGIINEIILPEVGDRNLHGNVSFNPQYFDRVTEISLKKDKGIVFIHSHPGPGWQGMSQDDIDTEKMLSPRVKAVTNLPLLGMTLGNNGDWSARFWNKSLPKIYHCNWCESVRVVGERYHVTFNDNLLKPPLVKEELVRTISAWGEHQQSQLSRIKVGIVGIGSVGSQIAESLMRTGIQNIVLIDFDVVQRKNLDRLHGLNQRDIGYLKSEVYSKILSKNKIYSSQEINSYPYSIVEEEGLERALDCDVIFCCVDRPWARFILNCISYAYLIPVIDGGIDASYNKRLNNLDQARWRTYTAGPQRRCMKCMEQYKPEDVSLEQTGLLEDPAYIKGLPESHFTNRGENVYAFSLSLAGMQMQQFLSFVLIPKGVYYGPKEMDFVTGNIDSDFKFECEDNCEFNSLIGVGDNLKEHLVQAHPIAELSRKTASKKLKNIFKILWRNLVAKFLS